MQGIRAIRVGVCLGVILLVGVSAGCCETCHGLWKGDAKPATANSAPTGQPVAGQQAPVQPTANTVAPNGFQVPVTPAGQFNNTPAPQAPEHAYGGIIR